MWQTWNKNCWDPKTMSFCMVRLGRHLFVLVLVETLVPRTFKSKKMYIQMYISISCMGFGLPSCWLRRGGGGGGGGGCTPLSIRWAVTQCIPHSTTDEWGGSYKVRRTLWGWAPGRLWGWALQGDSGPGHSENTLGFGTPWWSLHGDSAVGHSWGWALQGHSRVGHWGGMSEE